MYLKALGQGDVEQNLLGSDHKEIKTNYFVEVEREVVYEYSKAQVRCPS